MDICTVTCSGDIDSGYMLCINSTQSIPAAINMGASGVIVSLVNEIVIPYFPVSASGLVLLYDNIQF